MTHKYKSQSYVEIGNFGSTLHDFYFPFEPPRMCEINRWWYPNQIAQWNYTDKEVNELIIEVINKMKEPNFETWKLTHDVKSKSTHRLMSFHILKDHKSNYYTIGIPTLHREGATIIWTINPYIHPGLIKTLIKNYMKIGPIVLQREPFKMYFTLSRKYGGISLSDVKEVYNKSEAVQIHHPVPRHVSVMVQIPNGPFCMYQLDTTFLPQTKGAMAIGTMVDLFSKHAWARPLRNRSSLATWDKMGPILINEYKIHNSVYGERVSFKIQIDNGTEFRGMDDGFERMLKINLPLAIVVKGHPYHPWAQGQVERLNKTIKTRLRLDADMKGVNRLNDPHYKWRENLSSVIENINDTIHTTTKYSPSRLREICINGIENDPQAIDAVLFVRGRLTRRAESNRKYWENVKFAEVGDLVRIPMERVGTYVKSDLATWTRRLYKVLTVTVQKRTGGPVYSLTEVDNDGVAIPGAKKRFVTGNRILKVEKPEK